MQFAGLNNVFITAILDTGWEVEKKKLCPRSSVQDKGHTQVFHSFSYSDLRRPVNNFLRSF